MEILWPALGIGVIVVFVFYVLAQHWQRVLKQQTWTIRRLQDRLRDLEEMADPEFRRRLSESSPLPLEQVFNFSFRLSERFWGEALHISEEDNRFIREAGSFVGSVKLERWRSHTVATIAEVLPDGKAAGWQTRALDFYPDAGKIGDALSLWELALSRPRLSAERPPSLELVLRENSMDLIGHLRHSRNGNGNGHSGNGRSNGGRQEDVVFFRVPLDTAKLAGFRSHDPSETADNGNDAPLNENSWHAFYSDWNDSLGIEWQLRLRDLNRKSEWEKWRIFASAVAPLVAGEK
jgi:hypothetical protein